MKAVILAGGYGTRLAEETSVQPKPMVEIGGRPILWHIMKIYSAYGVNDFIICCGYKGDGYQGLLRDVLPAYVGRAVRSASAIDDQAARQRHRALDGHTRRHGRGDNDRRTDEAGRRVHRRRDLLSRVRRLRRPTWTFASWSHSIETQGALATLTAIQPPGRFGALVLGAEETKITTFQEKPHGDGGWINGGFFVVEPQVLDYIPDDSTIWERGPLERLADEGTLAAYKHRGYWQSMETLRDKMVLEADWESGNPPWKVW